MPSRGCPWPSKTLVLKPVVLGTAAHSSLPFSAKNLTEEGGIPWGNERNGRKPKVDLGFKKSKNLGRALHWRVFGRGDSMVYEFLVQTLQ